MSNLSQLTTIDNFISPNSSSNMCKIESIPSQMIAVLYNGLNFSITLDSGATVSYVKLDVATRLNLNIKPNNQLALLADQQTRMASLGEIDIVVCVQNIQMRLRALVMQHLQAECFGGTTFHVDNKIETNIKDGVVLIHGKYIVQQSNFQENMPNFPPPAEKLSPPKKDLSSSQNLTTNGTDLPIKLNAISLPSSKIIFPSNHLPIPMPSSLQLGYVSITPSFPDAIDNPKWSPQICEIINGAAMYENVSDVPITVAKHSHFRPNSVDLDQSPLGPPELVMKSATNLSSIKPTANRSTEDYMELLDLIKINQKVMTKDQINRLYLINMSFVEVYNSDLSEG